MSPHIRTFGIAATEFYQLIAFPVTQLTCASITKQYNLVPA